MGKKRSLYTPRMPPQDTALPSSLATTDDVNLHVAHWPVPSPQGVVQTLHGLGEYQGRFDRLARVLNAAGWAVAGIDHRAHGRSGGERGVIPNPQELLNDHASLHDQLSRHYRRLPHVFLGSSFGGLLAAQFATALSRQAPAVPWARPTDGVVLLAPALVPTLPGPQSATMSVLYRLVPDLPVSLAYMQSWGNSDPAVLAAKRADPLMHTRLTPRTCHFMMQTARQVLEHSGDDWTVPTLLSFTDLDRLVPGEACARFAERLPPGLLRTIRYKDMAHDLLHEPCADDLNQQIVAWLDAIR